MWIAKEKWVRDRENGIDGDMICIYYFTLELKGMPK